MKPPREIETHFVREENSPERYSDLYPPVTEHEIDRAFYENLQKYLESKQEQPAEKTHVANEIEPKTLAEETESVELQEPLSTEPATHDLENPVEVRVEAEPAAFSEIPPDMKVGPELYEAYDLPAKDLELLLFELDANPLQPEIPQEKKLEAEARSEV